MWTIREIKIRYKQSFLGGAWAILQPLSLMVVFSVIFTWFIQLPTEGNPYPIFSYTALLPWTFFATSISFGVPSLVGNMNLVTKIYFPREIIPISVVIASFVDFLVASTVYVGMLFFYKIQLYPTLFILPIIILIQIILTFGIIFIGSTLNVFYRDIRFAVPLAIQLWFYASPVIYPISVVPEELLSLYMLNPMAVLIDSYRRVILEGQTPQWQYLGLSALISIGIFILSYRFFKRMEMRFADLI
ncbi:ABC transporter permease [Chloroflexota bacterium]